MDKTLTLKLRNPNDEQREMINSNECIYAQWNEPAAQPDPKDPPLQGYDALIALRRQAEAERDQLRARVQELERERDAYRRAKEENDERYMLERDEARQERERLKDEAEDYDIINNPEMKAFWEDRDILKAQIQRLEAQAAAAALAETDAGALVQGLVEAATEWLAGGSQGSYNLRKAVEAWNRCGRGLAQRKKVKRGR